MPQHTPNGFITSILLPATQIVQPRNLVQHVIHQRDYNLYANAIPPESHDCHDVRPSVTGLFADILVVRIGNHISVGEPSEETEDGGQHVDAKDCGYEGQGWPGGASSGDEDEPVLGEGDFQEDDFLDGAPVLDDAAVWEEERGADDPGADGEEETQDDADDPDFGQLPLHGAEFVGGVVVGDGNGGNVGEEGEEDDEVGADAFVQDYHCCDEVDFQVEAQGDSVLNVGFHAVEDLTGDLWIG